MKQLSKVLGVGVIAGLSVAIILLSVVTFGSCNAVAFIAELCPDSLSLWGVHYTHDQLVNIVMRLREKDCKLNFSAKVFRFCNDHAVGGYRVYEEAMVVET